MKTSKVFLIVASLVLLTTFAAPSLAQSGGQPQIHVVNAPTRENGDNLQLSVFFNILDQQGNVMLDAEPNGQASIINHTVGGSPVQATVSKADTPIYVTLLIDASGSMQDRLEDVKLAAKQALVNAPPNAFFAVYQFNQITTYYEELPQNQRVDLTAIEDWTNDRNLIDSAINLISAPDGAPTCLFDATYRAIELLDEEADQPHERRAIILFTDGEDRMSQTDPNPCSKKTLSHVQYLAVERRYKNGEPIPSTTIHTIGLYNSNSNYQSDLDEYSLSQLASETGGFFAKGFQPDLEDMFDVIMQGLNSQWVAHTTILAAQGINDASLSVDLAEPAEDNLPPEGFQFTASRAHQRARCNNPTAYINSPEIDYGNLRAKIPVRIGCPEAVAVAKLTVIKDGGARTEHQPDPIQNPGDTITFDHSIEDWETDSTYLYRIEIARAVDGGFETIKHDPDNIDPYFHMLSYTYERQPILFNVETLSPNFERETLRIVLRFERERDKARVDRVSGTLFDSRGQDIRFGPLDFTEEDFQIDLPEEFWDVKGTQPIHATIELTERTLASNPQPYRNTNLEQVFESTRPGRWFMFLRFLTKNPTAPLLFLLFIVGCAFYWLYNKYQKAQRREPDIYPVYNEGTVIAEEPIPVNHSNFSQRNVKRSNGFKKANAPRLNITVARTANDLPPIEMELTDYPCVLGRDKHLPHGKLTVRNTKYFLNVGKGDPQIGHTHVEIRESGGQLYLVDLDSRNGTKVAGRRLEPNQPLMITEPTSVTLGRHTQLQLEPHTERVTE